MTKKDGDKLRDMQKELLRMSDDYRPVGAQPPSVGAESRSFGELAHGIQLVLEGHEVCVRLGS